jgi:hypothetical protein
MQKDMPLGDQLSEETAVAIIELFARSGRPGELRVNLQQILNKNGNSFSGNTNDIKKYLWGNIRDYFFKPHPQLKDIGLGPSPPQWGKPHAARKDRPISDFIKFDIHRIPVMKLDKSTNTMKQEVRKNKNKNELVFERIDLVPVVQKPERNFFYEEVKKS